MIRVIEHGRPIKSDYRVKCNMCGCVFQFDKSDVSIRAEIISFEENRWINHHYICCPDCGQEMYLGDNQVRCDNLNVII